MCTVKNERICTKCQQPKKDQEFVKDRKVCRECEGYRVKAYKEHSKANFLFGTHFENQPFAWVM